MIARLVGFILIYGSGALLAGLALRTVLGQLPFEGPVKGWLQRLSGKRNVLRWRGEACSLCSESIDPRVDGYDRVLEWHHRACVAKVLES